MKKKYPGFNPRFIFFYFRLHPKDGCSSTTLTSKRSTGCKWAQIQIRTNPVQSDVYCGRSFNSNAGNIVDGVVYSKYLLRAHVISRIILKLLLYDLNVWKKTRENTFG